MSKYIIRVMSVFLVLAMAMSLSGCTIVDEMISGCFGSSDAPKTNVAILWGNRSNNPTPSINTTAASRVINDAITTYGSLSVITVEGKPSAVADYTFTEQSTWTSEQTVKKQQQIMRENINSALISAIPTTPEADTLAAISLGARSLNVKMTAESEMSSRNVLLIFDNGLGTSGELDFTKQLLRVEPEAIVQMLEGADAIPDLTGIEIVWIGIGDVAGEQAPLNAREIIALKAIWQAVLKAGGADSIVFASDLPSNNAADDSYPDVSEVILLRDDSDPVESVLTNPVILDPSRVCFKYNSTEFAVDINEVHEALNPYVEFLNYSSDTKLLIAGTCSRSGAEDYNMRLSLRRAEAIKSELVRLGVPPEQLVCVGLGYEKHPFRAIVVDNNGKEIEDPSQNMAAILVEYESAEAKLLMEIGLT